MDSTSKGKVDRNRANGDLADRGVLFCKEFHKTSTPMSLCASDIEYISSGSSYIIILLDKYYTVGQYTPALYLDLCRSRGGSRLSGMKTTAAPNSSTPAPQGTDTTPNISSTPQTTSVDSLPAPLVFQCGKCRIIIGDSFSFSSSSQQNQTITLASASNIKRIPEFHTSTTGYDVLSSYVMFHCENCEHPLGRYYVTTSEDLDHLRKMFTFNVNNITSYELGKTQHGKVPETWNTEAEQPPALDPINSTLVQTIKEHHEDIQKIQVVLVGLVDRVSTVELIQKRLLHLDNGERAEQETERPSKHRRQS